MQLEHRLSALLQLHLHSQLSTWLQWIGQRQLQDETRNIWGGGLGASYIRYLTVTYAYPHDTASCGGCADSSFGHRQIGICFYGVSRGAVLVLASWSWHSLWCCWSAAGLALHWPKSTLNQSRFIYPMEVGLINCMKQNNYHTCPCMFQWFLGCVCNTCAPVNRTS